MSKEANKAPPGVGALHLPLGRNLLPGAPKSIPSWATWGEGDRRNTRTPGLCGASWRTMFNVQCLMACRKLPHSIIESNQAFPLGVRPEPKSPSPGRALVQFCSSRSQFQFKNSLTSGCSRRRANPSESPSQCPHDELRILLRYRRAFSFDLSALLGPYLREARGIGMNANGPVHELKGSCTKAAPLLERRDTFPVISWSPTMKWPKKKNKKKHSHSWSE